MSLNSLPCYSVTELNSTIANLIDRGFSARFILDASIVKINTKKGHQWLTLSDGKSTISAVIWASVSNKINYKPVIDDGVLIVGKLNFWINRASLSVQVIDIKPTISTILRKFEIVRKKLEQEGLIDEARHRLLPRYPKAIGILTSAPSSALADIERTAKERWPLTKLVVIPIPVQGNVNSTLTNILKNLSRSYKDFDIEAIILARGGGSREDLAFFDDEELCRELALFPIPVVTGIGHEDDWTVADLVADFRAANPTAAVITLLPSRSEALNQLREYKKRLNDYSLWVIKKFRDQISDQKRILRKYNLSKFIQIKRVELISRQKLLQTFSPERLVARGRILIRSSSGKIVSKVKDVALHDRLTIYMMDGNIESSVDEIKSN
tara:strand:- start:517 stop:1662 length:1146 start_codon:yes stop_codon:yes gene_type:complete